jgi:hypothetical protein
MYVGLAKSDFGAFKAGNRCNVLAIESSFP